jgi:transposase-like protein
MENPNSKVYSQEDVRRLKEIVNEGMAIMQEVETLNEGLRDTIKAVAEEVGIKPAQLSKAIRIAHKASLQDEREKFDQIEEILEITGKTL